MKKFSVLIGFLIIWIGCSGSKTRSLEETINQSKTEPALYDRWLFWNGLKVGTLKRITEPKMLNHAYSHLLNVSAQAGQPLSHSIPTPKCRNNSGGKVMAQIFQLYVAADRSGQAQAIAFNVQIPKSAKCKGKGKRRRLEVSYKHMSLIYKSTPNIVVSTQYENVYSKFKEAKRTNGNIKEPLDDWFVRNLKPIIDEFPPEQN